MPSLCRSGQRRRPRQPPPPRCRPFRRPPPLKLPSAAAGTISLHGSASVARNVPEPKRLLQPQHLRSPRRPRLPALSKIVLVANLHFAPIRFLVRKPRRRQDRRVVSLAANPAALKRSVSPFASPDRQSVREGANSTTSATRCKKNKTFCNANVLLPTTNRSASAPRAPKGDAAPKKNNNAADVADVADAAVVEVDPVKATARKATVPRAIPPDRTPAARRSRVATPQAKPMLNSSK